MIKHIFVFQILFVFINSQNLSKEPIDQFNYATKSVVFECTIENYSSETDLIEWCKNNFCTWGRPIELNDGRLQYKSLSRYFIVGNRTKGEWNLLIENITVNDEGEYKCTITRRSNELSKPIKIESKPVVLKLIRSPQSININSNTSIINLIVNKINLITCTVYDGVPAPVINWRLSDGTSLNEYSKLEQQIENDTKINKYLSELRVTGNFNMEGKSIECYVEHQTLNKTMSQTINIQLNYAPIVELKYEPNDEYLIEGKTYKFSCNANAEPRIQNMKLYLNNINNKIESFNNELTITATRDFNKKIIICECKNAIDTTLLHKTINVTYSPKFVETLNEIIIINKTQSLTLNCIVDSNPNSTIIWLRNNNELIEIGNKLTLYNVNIASEYTCKISNPNYDSINFTSAVIVEGPPTIIGEKFFTLEKNNDNLNIEFKILSSPAKQDEPLCKRLVGVTTIDEINENKNYEIKILNDKIKYTIQKTFDNQNIVSKYELKILSVSNDDYGVYSCIVSNSNGKSEFLFEIHSKSDNKSLLVIILASVFSVLLVLIVLSSLSIIVCRYRLKTKQNFQKKNLPNVSDDISSNQSGNSPNLSVSEWMTIVATHDDQNSDKSNSSQKNLLSNEHLLNLNSNSNPNIAVIMPNDNNSINSMYKYHSPIVPQYTRALIDSFSTYDTHQNFTKMSHYQSANILYSKFQTNV